MKLIKDLRGVLAAGILAAGASGLIGCATNQQFARQNVPSIPGFFVPPVPTNTGFNCFIGGSIIGEETRVADHVQLGDIRDTFQRGSEIKAIATYNFPEGNVWRVLIETFHSREPRGNPLFQEVWAVNNLKGLLTYRFRMPIQGDFVLRFNAVYHPQTIPPSNPEYCERPFRVE